MIEPENTVRNITLTMLTWGRRAPGGPHQPPHLDAASLAQSYFPQLWSRQSLTGSPISNGPYHLWAFSCVGLQPGMSSISLFQSKSHTLLLTLIQEVVSNTSSFQKQSSPPKCYHTCSLYHTLPHFTKVYLTGFGCGCLQIKSFSPEDFIPWTSIPLTSHLNLAQSWPHGKYSINICVPGYSRLG